MRASDLQVLPFFSTLPVEEIEWIATHALVISLEEGQYLVTEGAVVAQFHVVIDGRLMLTRSTADSLVVVGSQYPGNYGGILPLLSGEPSPFNIEAAIDSQLLALDKELFQQFTVACPTAAQLVLSDLPPDDDIDAKQADYITTMGKLTASLLHELNMPAVTSNDAASMLAMLLPQLHRTSFELDTVGLSFEELENLLAFEQRIHSSGGERPLLAPEAHAALEREVSVWLSTRDVENSEDAALTFVSAGITPTELNRLADELPATSLIPAVNWLALSLEAARLLDEIRLSTSRIRNLISGLQMYSYLAEPVREAVDIHELLETTLKSMRYKLRTVNVDRTFADQLPTVYANRSQLEQVWMNLIDNALDAMDGEGHLTLVTSATERIVSVEVQDDGSGIRPEHLDSIFQPFYTTKEVAQGTGLGLDMTYRIIKQHNGDIDVQSKPGMTRFIVTLPVA